MCTSNYSSICTNSTKTNDNGNHNEQASNNAKDHSSQKRCTEALESSSNDHRVNVGQSYDTELKQHLINIERKIDVLCKVWK